MWIKREFFLRLSASFMSLILICYLEKVLPSPRTYNYWLLTLTLHGPATLVAHCDSSQTLVGVDYNLQRQLTVHTMSNPGLDLLLSKYLLQTMANAKKQNIFPRINFKISSSQSQSTTKPKKLWKCPCYWKIVWWWTHLSHITIREVFTTLTNI